jgi:hypothetical protein
MQIVGILLGLVRVATETGLTTAMTNADPGDVIEVNGGTYDVNLLTSRDGTSDQPITLRAAPGEIVVLSARDATLRTLDLQSASHWRIEGLKIRGSRHANVRIDGGTDVVIDGCEIYDGTKKGIIANGDLITIRNSIIRDIKQPLSGDDTEGIVAWRASRLRIHDNFIATPGDGILIGGANELTRISTDVRIYRNHIHTRSSWVGVYKVENAIDVKGAEDVVIADNEIHRYYDHVAMDGGVALLVQSHDEGAPDLRIDDVRIERNEIYDVGRALSVQSVHGPGRTVDFRRNVVYAVSQDNLDGGKYPGGVFVGDWEGIDIDNNTFVDVDHAAVHAWGSLSGLRVRNNVFRRTGGVVKDRVSGLVDYSCRYTTPETGGAHDVVSSQHFVDDAGRDYRLAPDSPCIDEGTEVGLSFEGTRPDIGRFEYGTTSGTARVPSADEGGAPSPMPSDGRPVDWASGAGGGDEQGELGPPLGDSTGPGDGTALLEDLPPGVGKDPADMTAAGVLDKKDGLVGGCVVGRRSGSGAGLIGGIGIAALWMWKRRSVRRRRAAC